MAQRNIDINDQLWDALQMLSKATFKSRAKLVRDCLYTMLKAAAEGKPLCLESAPYRIHAAGALAPHQAYVETGGATGVQLTTIDPLTGLIVKGAPAGSYLASYPAAPRVMPDYVAAALAHKPGDPRAAKVSGYVENLKTAPKPDESE